MAKARLAKEKARAPWKDAGHVVARTLLGSVLRTDSNKVEILGKKGQARYLCGLSMAEIGDAGTKHVADLAYVLDNNKESFYDPELVASKGG